LSKDGNILDKKSKELLTMDKMSINMTVDGRIVKCQEVIFMRAALRKARKARKVSVSELAQQLGISKSYYYKIESGIRDPNVDLAREIAVMLAGSVDSLFFDFNLDNMSKNRKEVS
jgi:putative transcriptional regulator